jgi:transposase-like protein
MWTWTALDAEHKLIIRWQLGARDAANGYSFIRDVRDRLANKVQMTTDGNRIYLDAIDFQFRAIDCSILTKV